MTARSVLWRIGLFLAGAALGAVLAGGFYRSAFRMQSERADAAAETFRQDRLESEARIDSLTRIEDTLRGAMAALKDSASAAGERSRARIQAAEASSREFEALYLQYVAGDQPCDAVLASCYLARRDMEEALASTEAALRAEQNKSILMGQLAEVADERAAETEAAYGVAIMEIEALRTSNTYLNALAAERDRPFLDLGIAGVVVDHNDRVKVALAVPIFYSWKSDWGRVRLHVAPHLGMGGNVGFMVGASLSPIQIPMGR